MPKLPNRVVKTLASRDARLDFLNEKSAEIPWHEAIDLAGLGLIAAPVVTQMAAPEFYDEHETAMHGADLAGLALLMGTTGHKLISPS